MQDPTEDPRSWPENIFAAFGSIADEASPWTSSYRIHRKVTSEVTPKSRSVEYYLHSYLSASWPSLEIICCVWGIPYMSIGQFHACFTLWEGRLKMLLWSRNLIASVIRLKAGHLEVAQFLIKLNWNCMANWSLYTFSKLVFPLRMEIPF